MYKRSTHLCLWLLLGFGSRLQVVASLSITEILVLLVAPFVFLRDYPLMKRHGVMTFFVLSLFVMMGCIVASISNQLPIEFILRGFAIASIISCSIIFSHWILCRDPAGFKWYILMLPVSAFVSTFVFQTANEMVQFGGSVEEIMNGPIFWITRLYPLVMAATKGWYLQTPGFINILAPIFMATFSLFSSSSGRSAMLGSVGFVALVLLGGKKRQSMSRIMRHFWILCIGGFVLVGTVYTAYKISVVRGWLGEDALKKYEIQSDGGQGGIGRLILGGRGESVIGIFACFDKPIVGWGPWAQDENGYINKFYAKYGTFEDLRALDNRIAYLARNGMPTSIIPVHSYITQFWVWFGIFGLIFVLYIIFVVVRYLRQDVTMVPQWFAWLACSTPSMFWAIFFSPFTERFGTVLFVVACLMARAVRKGSFQLPIDMIYEIEKNERR